MTYCLRREAEDTIVAAVRKGTPRRVAVTAAGVRWRDFQDWLQFGADDARSIPVDADELANCRRLNQRITQAEAEHHAEMIASIQEAATTPNAKTGVPDWRAADTMMSKHPAYRDDWREERRVQVEVQPFNPAHALVRELSDEELLALPDGSEDDTSPSVSQAPELPAPAASPDAAPGSTRRKRKRSSADPK